MHIPYKKAKQTHQIIYIILVLPNLESKSSNSNIFSFNVQMLTIWLNSIYKQCLAFSLNRTTIKVFYIVSIFVCKYISPAMVNLQERRRERV